MKNFNYFETVTFFHRGIWEQFRQGISFIQSEAISFDSMWLYPEDENVLNNFVIIIESLFIELSINKKFKRKSIELYQKLKEKFNDVNVNLYMTKYEIEIFEESIELLENSLSDFPTD